MVGRARQNRHLTGSADLPPPAKSHPSAVAIDQAVAAAQASDVTIVTTMNVWGDVPVSVTGPYDIAWYPTARTYLAPYDYQRCPSSHSPRC